MVAPLFSSSSLNTPADSFLPTHFPNPVIDSKIRPILKGANSPSTSPKKTVSFSPTQRTIIFFQENDAPPFDLASSDSTQEAFNSVSAAIDTVLREKEQKALDAFKLLIDQRTSEVLFKKTLKITLKTYDDLINEAVKKINYLADLIPSSEFEKEYESLLEQLEIGKITYLANETQRTIKVFKKMSLNSPEVFGVSGLSSFINTIAEQIDILQDSEAECLAAFPQELTALINEVIQEGNNLIAQTEV